jgi:hypothetical protein
VLVEVQMQAPTVGGDALVLATKMPSRVALLTLHDAETAVMLARHGKSSG